MTYRELRKALNELSSDELDYEAMAYDGWNDEYLQIKSLKKSTETFNINAVGQPIIMLQ